MYFLGLFVSVLVAVVVWLGGVGNPFLYFSSPAPPGQTLYVWSKLFGLLAMSALVWQAVTGLLSGVFKQHIKGASLRFHRVNGMVLGAFILLHASFFVGGVSVRSGHFASKPLLLDFSNYYSSRLSIGLLAFVLFVVALLVPWLVRSKVSAKVRRMLHVFALGVLPLAAIHAFSIGSETRSALCMGLFLLLMLVLVLASVFRLRNMFKVEYGAN